MRDKVKGTLTCDPFQTGFEGITLDEERYAQLVDQARRNLRRRGHEDLAPMLGLDTPGVHRPGGRLEVLEP